MPTTPSPLAVTIVASRAAENDLVLLTSAMHALVLDSRHPLALEIAGTPTRKSFVLRASTPEALAHAAAQLRARYPQAKLLPVPPEVDPFRLEAGETVSALELVAGAAPSQPLRVFEDQELAQEGIDPVLGLLAALENLPSATRAVAQLAMMPASPNWSQTYQRQALEHALEPERQQRLLTRGATGPSWMSLILMAAALGLIVLFQQVHGLIPEWLLQAGEQLLKGQSVHFTAGEQAQLIIGGITLVLAAFLFFVVIDQVKKRLFPKRLYDQRLVAQKTRGVAYRARLRFYVIGPDAHQTGHALHYFSRRLRRGFIMLWRSPARWRQEWSEARTYLEQKRKQCVTQGGGTPGDTEVRWYAVLALFSLSACHESWRSLQHSGQQFARWRQQAREDKQRRREQRSARTAMLAQLVASYRQFHLASGGYFLPRRLAGGKARKCLRGAWWRDIASSTHLLSMETLANLWHLPLASMLSNLALVESHSARTILIPPSLAASPGTIIGLSEHAGHQLPVPLLPDLLTMHGLVAGKTGEGKSTFMEHLARAAMERGGLVVIDPHGDLAEHILLQVPAHRADDVVLIDLSDLTYAIGLNPLDVTLGRGRDKAISDLLKTFSFMWASSWGPRMENAFRAALRTLFDANVALVGEDPREGPQRQYTLLSVLPLFTRESFRHALLQYVTDPFVHSWWGEYYEPLNQYMQRDISNPVLSKTTQFEGEIARHIVGQSCSTINVGQLIKEQKIVLVKLAKGVVGSDVASLLGATLLGLVQTTLEEQGALPEQARARMMIILDEFQTLGGVDYGALAELRKYGATFVLATQSLEYLQKLDPVLLPTVLANVKHLTVFQLSDKDAYTLRGELGVEQEHITNLNSHMCYARWTATEQRQPTFSLTLQLPQAFDPVQAAQIRSRSRQRYGVPIPIVEACLRSALLRANEMVRQAQTHRAREAEPEEAFQPVGRPAATQREEIPAAKPRAEANHRGSRGSKKKRPAREGSIVPMELLDISGEMSVEAEPEGFGE